MLVDLSLLQFPVHSHVAIVCSLKEYHGVGDHYLYICDVSRFMGMKPAFHESATINGVLIDADKIKI